MHCPSGGGVTAVVLVIVVLRVAAGGHRLRTGRGHCPGAAVDVAAGLAGRDRNGGPVYLFGSFKLDFIGIDRERQIKAAGSGLRRCAPLGRVIICIGGVGDFLVNVLVRNQTTIQHGQALPVVTCGRQINVGVVEAARAKIRRCNQIVCGLHIQLRGCTFGVVLNNPQLCIVIILVRGFQHFIVCGRVGGCSPGGKGAGGKVVNTMLSVKRPRESWFKPPQILIWLP